MFDALKSILTSSSYDHEYATTLDYSTPDTEIDGCEEDPDEPITDQDYEEEDSETPVYESFSFGYMKRAIEFYDDIDQKTGKRKHSWKNVKHQFRRIPYQYYLARFRTYIEESGTKKQKIDSVEDFVYDKFERARELLRPVHDIDLKRWAQQQARSTFFHEFVASDTWILAFKHKYNICSRKVTKISVANCRESFLSSPIYVFSQFVTKREVMNEEEIKKSADQFVSDVRALLPKYNEDFVLNTDQSGLEFEIHSNRTLAIKARKPLYQLFVLSMKQLTATLFNR